jgi:ABC-type uncharacterized transport system permease subunit
MEILQAYKSASDLTIQLITLATGILALSITFMRDVIKSNSPTWALKGAWVILLLSVCFGVWTLMGITGSIFNVVSDPEKFKTETYGMNVILPSSLQITSFVTAIILLIIFCARTLKPKKRKNPRGMWLRKLRKAK